MRIVMNGCVLGVAVLCGLVFEAKAAEAGTINFSSLSQAGTGTTIHGSGFVVEGFVFSSSYPSGGGLLTYNRDDPSHPNDDSAASTSLLEYRAGEMTTITRSGGGTFDLYNIDLAPWGVNQGGPDFTVLFTGIKSDLSTVTQSLTVQNAYTAGRPLLQTRVFSGFTGLTSVSMTQGVYAYASGTAYQFNNLVVDETSHLIPVPEPGGTVVLLGTGLTGLAGFRRRVSSRRGRLRPPAETPVAAEPDAPPSAARRVRRVL